MVNSQNALKLLRICTTVLFLIALISPCHAVLMRVTGGFDSVVRSGPWTPIAVELRNSEAASIQGTLEIRQGDWSVPICTESVDLPANSTKLYHIYARLREYGEIRVLLRTSDGVLSAQKVDTNFAGTSDVTLVSVGPRTSQLSFLNREPLNAKASSRSSIYVGSVTAAELPDRPAAYEGVDVLVISNLPVSSTSPAALSAIGMWVASGGTLVIATGPDYRSYQNKFFDELLPVRITGAGTVTPSQGLGFGGFAAGSMAIAKSVPKPGIATKIIAESGTPVYAERMYGAGKVIFLAFDHLSSPFKDWNGQSDFWKGIITSTGVGGSLIKTQGADFFQRERYGAYYNQGGQESLVNVVQQNPSVRMPAFSTIALFLLAYIVMLVPVNYFTLNRMRRKEMAWITTPAIVLIFTAGAYFIGYGMKGGHLKINQASFIQGSSNARYAFAVAEATVFSPASRSYQVTLADPFALGQVLGSADDKQFPTAEIGDGLRMDRLRIAMWSSRTLESSSGVDLGGHLEANLELNGNMLSGTVRNGTDLDLTECLLIWGQHSVTVTGLERGGSARVSLEHQSAAPPLSPSVSTDRVLSERYLEFLRGVGSGMDRPMLLARVRDGRVFRVGHGARTESCTYIVFNLDYAMGREFSLDPGSVPGSITDYRGSQGDSGQAATAGPGVRVSLGPSGWAIVSYRLPVPPDSRLTELKVVQSADSRSHRGYPSGQASAVVYNCAEGTWDQATFGSNLQKPQQYLSADHIVKVRIAGGNDWYSGWVGISARGQRR